MAEIDKEPFVSGLYRAEEDAGKRPLPSIDTIVTSAKKVRKIRKSYGAVRTDAVISAESRRYPDK